jgi:hypothetical protein
MKRRGSRAAALPRRSRLEVGKQEGRIKAGVSISSIRATVNAPMRVLSMNSSPRVFLAFQIYSTCAAERQPTKCISSDETAATRHGEAKSLTPKTMETAAPKACVR